MRAGQVTFCLRNGSQVVLSSGDLIGRADTAALILDDPRVSEAHAIVSFRRGKLCLLSLRRMIAVDGKPVSELSLEPQMVVEFAPGLYLKVLKVELPKTVLGIRAKGLRQRTLNQVSSIYSEPSPDVVGRFEPEAPAHLWFVGNQAKLTVEGDESRVLQAGQSFLVGRVEFEVLDIECRKAGNASTALDGSLQAPLELIGYFDSVEIRRYQQPSVHFGGLGARIISELIAVQGPVSWRGLARELWPNDERDVELRRKWDASLARLRRKLREQGIRGDLLVSDGAGCIQLCLYKGDVTRDEG